LPLPLEALSRFKRVEFVLRRADAGKARVLFLTSAKARFRAVGRAYGMTDRVSTASA